MLDLSHKSPAEDVSGFAKFYARVKYSMHDLLIRVHAAVEGAHLVMYVLDDPHPVVAPVHSGQMDTELDAAIMQHVAAPMLAQAVGQRGGLPIDSEWTAQYEPGDIVHLEFFDEWPSTTSEQS